MTTFRVDETVPFDPNNFKKNARHRACMASLTEGDGASSMGTTDLVRLVTLQCVAGTCLCVVGLSIVVFLFMLYWQTSSLIVNFDVAARPYVAEALNTTMRIVGNADVSSAQILHALSDVATLTQSTVPAMQNAINQTSSIVTRLESLATHPVLRLSLGDD